MSKLLTYEKLVYLVGILIIISIIMKVLPYIVNTSSSNCKEWETRIDVVLVPGIGGSLRPMPRTYNVCIKRE